MSRYRYSCRDPIEAQAMANAMNDTKRAARGIYAGMKAATVIENGVIPGIAGLQNLNPGIDEEGWNIKVQRDTAPWPQGFKSRRADVSPFEYGGTNGHVIVEEVKSLLLYYQHGKPMSAASYDNRASRPFMEAFSAHDKVTLQRNIAAHAKVVLKY
ncbi:MAG: hypothetical protein Q9179_002468 [Wetmoreana sp. 5 TL-2023]